MPTQPLRPTNRARVKIAAVMAATIGAGSTAYVTLSTGERVPPAVALAAELTIDWEAIVTTAYWDPLGKVFTVCAGETKGVKKGDHYTVAECKAMFTRRATKDYWEPMLRCAPRLAQAPLGVQWAMLDGAYNFGVGGWCQWSASADIRRGDWRAACDDQTKINKAGGRVIPGLVKRREMGDATRIGEGEACVTGIAMDGTLAPLAITPKVGGGPGA